jgi:hypothetical protein
MASLYQPPKAAKKCCHHHGKMEADSQWQRESASSTRSLWREGSDPLFQRTMTLHGLDPVASLLRRLAKRPS